MSNRRSAVALLVFALALGSTALAAAQSGFEPSRLADGKPDLQGVWDFRTLTPLQRPEDRADQALLTPEEAAEIEAAAVQRAIEADRPSEVRTEPLPVGGDVGAYNNFWFDRGAGVVDDRRTSLIVDPPNGRLPEPQPEAKRQATSNDDTAPPDRPVRFRVGGIGTHGPEDRGLAERCLLGFNTGPPIVPGGYNQNMQLFQTSEHVVILNEMVHDARIVPLDGRDPLPEDMRQWMGSSRGRWEGDTLIVETTNFTGLTSSFSPSVVSAIGTGRTLHLTERFRRVADDTLLYEFTVNDPTSFTRPFAAAIPMKRGTAPLFEYACHEGNYGMLNLLSGARAQEREASEQ
ncbi:MAG: hypothetical protein OXQ28_09880 [Acidobacteriota bacterium]|nr:hypothetical protein [Acidobacteriota bacterium]